MTTTTPLESAERIHADHASVKHLGHWTEATGFDVRARRAGVVLDLRSPRIGWDGPVTDAEIRIRRAGSAQLTAMCSRAYLDDLRRAHREGGLPVIDDPTRERTH
ncbi:hypothetical protein [Streptomyces sp. NPDC001250]|uniref:hypothetical protein n=1 Tax=unclassified Streptomyces TaxID=2593676 RepID=UPI00331C9E60